MKTIFILIVLNFLNACGIEARSSDPPQIECKILNNWDFKRCENSEVICYTNNDGLSCKWKST